MSDPIEIKLPLEPWVREIVKATVREHAANCPVAARVGKLEMRFSALIGFMIGSGTLGGVAGAFLTSILGG